MAVRLSHIGGPTTVIEAYGWRLLVDPTFDPPGRRYAFGWGTSSTKLAGPAVDVEHLEPADAVLLSHDHHADNLDDAGRAQLPGVPVVLTTAPGRRRLGLAHAVGLRPWQVHTLRRAGAPDLTVTATPCRHGPPLSRPVVGAVIGFALQWAGIPGAVWVTGDTTLFRGLRAVARTIDVEVAVVHAGAVRFPRTGRFRYSMDARDVVELIRLVRPRVVVPVHCEGWSHFSEQYDALRARIEDAGPPADVRFPRPGEAVDV